MFSCVILSLLCETVTHRTHSSQRPDRISPCLILHTRLVGMHHGFMYRSTLYTCPHLYCRLEAIHQSQNEGEERSDFFVRLQPSLHTNKPIKDLPFCSASKKRYGFHMDSPVQICYASAQNPARVGILVSARPFRKLQLQGTLLCSLMHT